MLNFKQNIRVEPLLIVNCNKLIYNHLFISKFHSSFSLLSDKDKVKSDVSNLSVDEEKLQTRIAALKVEGSDLTNNSSNFIPGGEELQESLSEFKKLRAENIFSEAEVKSELNNFVDYVAKHPNENSSYSEAFPKLFNKAPEVYVDYAKSTDLISNSEIEGNTDELKKEEGFESIKLILAELNKCINSGNYDENCISKLNLSSILTKIVSNSSSIPNNAKEAAAAKIVKESLEEVANNNIIDTIKDIKLGDLYDTYLNVKKQVPFEIKANHLEIGFNLVGYGLLLRSYNKFVYNRPIHPSLTGAELEVIHATRTISRFWFAGLVAPLMLFSFQQMRAKGGMVDVTINSSASTSTNVLDKTTTNSNGLGLFFLLKQKVKTQISSLSLSSWSGWILILTILIFIILFWMLDGMSFIYYIKDLRNNMFFVKYFVSFIILIPVLINVITLYFISKIEKTGEISIQQHTKNNISLRLRSLSIFNKYINYINKIGKNKELLKYYKGRCRAESVFYIFILILYLTLLNSFW